MSRHTTTRMLRRFGDATVGRRRLAKALFWLSGQLGRIKTYKRYYRFDPTRWDRPEDAPLPKMKPAGRHWTSCTLSSRLMGQSMQLDWDHWDHWACVHDTCGGDRCAECGGIACDEFPDEQERAS